jgi:hypothetical protein
MRNIFLLYMPPGNPEAMIHYQDTIRNKVPFDRIAPYVEDFLVRATETRLSTIPICPVTNKQLC